MLEELLDFDPEMLSLQSTLLSVNSGVLALK